MRQGSVCGLVRINGLVFMVHYVLPANLRSSGQPDAEFLLFHFASSVLVDFSFLNWRLFAV
jgi:hypothetical protein